MTYSYPDYGPPNFSLDYTTTTTPAADISYVVWPDDRSRITLLEQRLADAESRIAQLEKASNRKTKAKGS